jgi:hypothetical protein
VDVKKHATAYRMSAPCSNCPFTTTAKGTQVRESLRPGRMREIKDFLLNDGHFVCHLTTPETGDGSNRQCAGAINYQKLMDVWPNNAARACIRVSYGTGMMTGSEADDEMSRRLLGPASAVGLSGEEPIDAFEKAMRAAAKTKLSNWAGIPDEMKPTKRQEWKPITDEDVQR